MLKLLRVVACLDKIVCCTQDVFSHFDLHLIQVCSQPVTVRALKLSMLITAIEIYTCIFVLMTGIFAGSHE